MGALLLGMLAGLGNKKPVATKTVIMKTDAELEGISDEEVLGEMAEIAQVHEQAGIFQN